MHAPKVPLKISEASPAGCTHGKAIQGCPRSGCSDILLCSVPPYSGASRILWDCCWSHVLWVLTWLLTTRSSLEQKQARKWMNKFPFKSRCESTWQYFCELAVFLRLCIFAKLAVFLRLWLVIHDFYVESYPIIKRDRYGSSRGLPCLQINRTLDFIELILIS